MPVCKRCGTDHSSSSGIDFHAASLAETRENEDIRRMFDRGEDDGRRPDNAAFLCLVGHIRWLLRDDPRPPGPTAWEVLLGEDAI